MHRQGAHLQLEHAQGRRISEDFTCTCLQALLVLTAEGGGATSAAAVLHYDKTMTTQSCTQEFTTAALCAWYVWKESYYLFGATTTP